MPRRPLFCRTCDDLLKELAEAADALARPADVGAPVKRVPLSGGLPSEADLRSRYFELKQQVVWHRRTAHRTQVT